MAEVKTQFKISTDLGENLKIIYKRKSILGGIIKWWVEVKKEKMFDDLHIHVPNIESIDKIFINGVEIKI